MFEAQKIGYKIERCDESENQYLFSSVFWDDVKLKFSEKEGRVNVGK